MAASSSVQRNLAFGDEGFHHEPEQTLESETEDAWRKKNLLTFGKHDHSTLTFKRLIDNVQTEEGSADIGVCSHSTS